MSMLRGFDYLFSSTPSNTEIPIILCYQNSVVESLVFSHEKDVPDSNILYTELSIIDKGLDGLGVDVIKYVTNNPDDTENYLRFSQFTIHTLLTNIKIYKDRVYSFKKVDFGGDVYLGFVNVLVNERR